LYVDGQDWPFRPLTATHAERAELLNELKSQQPDSQAAKTRQLQGLHLIKPALV
jgi:hypothetical protein